MSDTHQEVGVDLMDGCKCSERAYCEVCDRTERSHLWSLVHNLG